MNFRGLFSGMCLKPSRHPLYSRGYLFSCNSFLASLPNLTLCLRCMEILSLVASFPPLGSVELASRLPHICRGLHKESWDFY